MPLLLSILAVFIFASEHQVFAKSTTTANADTVESTTTAKAELLARLNQLDKKLLVGLSGLKPHIKELAELNRQQQASKSESGMSRIDKILETKYPASYALPGYEKNPVALEKLIDKSINKLRTTTKACFPNGVPLIRPDIHCKKVVEGCRDDLGANAGNLYQVIIDSGLNEIKKEISPNYTWKSSETIAGSPSDFLNMRDERHFSYCKLAAMAGLEFTPLAVFLEFEQKPSWFIYPPKRDMKSIVESCVAFKNNVNVFNERLDNLILKYPKSTSLMDLKKVRQEGQKMCSAEITDLCKNTYMVKEKMIHAYRTKNCEVREVTKEDVKKDIDDFRKSGQTEAAILTHSTIIDLLDDCHAALNAGYSWDYKAPDQGNCKRSNVE